MKNKPDLKLLERFLALHPENKEKLKDFMGSTTLNSVDMWRSNGAFPRTKRRFILEFINRELRRDA